VRRTIAKLAALLAALFVTAAAYGAPTTPPPARPALATPTAACPGAIVPMYGEIAPMWRKLTASAPRTTTAIANLGNGPGQRRDPASAALFARARAAGIRVVGYVYTSFGRRPLSQVRRDVRRWARWYPVDGVFVDNVTSNGGQFRYYRTVSRYIRASGTPFIVMNGYVTRKYMRLTDIVLMLEGNLADFRRFRTPAWTRSFEAWRMASIVYGVPGRKAMRSVLRQASLRNVGTVYVTDAKFPTPYFSLPRFSDSRNAFLRARSGCSSARGP
jgi:hypothetical protein